VEGQSYGVDARYYPAGMEFHVTRESYENEFSYLEEELPILILTPY
jgi:hypothetical protein